VAGNLGATTVQRLADQLDQPLRQAAAHPADAPTWLAQAAQHLEPLKLGMAALAQDLQAALQPTNVDPAMPSADAQDMADAALVVQELRKRLSLGDATALEWALAHQHQLQASLNGNLPRFNQALRDFDFEQALHLLDTHCHE
jgi:hypothetical protein